jgi:hypothetical protein
VDRLGSVDGRTGIGEERSLTRDCFDFRKAAMGPASRCRLVGKPQLSLGALAEPIRFSAVGLADTAGITVTQ